MATAGRLALFLLGAHAAWAQYVVSARAGTIEYVRGQVLIDGQLFRSTPLKFPMLQAGQVLSTGDGRAEILLGPGVFLRLGENGAVRMLDTRLEDAQIEVQQGTALVEVVEMPAGSGVHVMLGPSRTDFSGMGLYRFETGSNELRVFGGRAEVFEGDRRAEAERGKVIHLGDTLRVSKFDLRQKDALHQWAAHRSFLLYRSTLQSPSRQTNWEVTRISPVNNELGLPSDQDITYLSNRDFGVMFSSRPFIGRTSR
jgi:hypothetical protein